VHSNAFVRRAAARAAQLQIKSANLPLVRGRRERSEREGSHNHLEFVSGNTPFSRGG